MSASRPRTYQRLLADAAALYPGVRIGRPGLARTYRPTIAARPLLRLRFDVHTEGASRVAPGAAILVGNHSNALDPGMVVIGTGWRISAFTKLEAFEGRGAVFFRFMGQIPLRRGDADSTAWAMEVAQHALAAGGKIGIYPEGTRSPLPRTLHRLHKRVLISVIEANPDVPVHAVVTTYDVRSRWRLKVLVRVSDPLPVDPRTMTPDQITDMVREGLLGLGGLEYSDRYSQVVKAELREARSQVAPDA